MRVAALAAALLLAACSRSPQTTSEEVRATPPAGKLRPSPFDSNFWSHWSDGKVEVCRYETYGPKGAGSTVMTTRVEGRTMFSSVIDRQGERSEMSSVSLELDAGNNRPAGSALSVVRSIQQPMHASWTQMTLGTSRGFATYHAVGQPDTQQVLDYSPPGMPIDALVLWARRIGWPRIKPGVRYPVDVITMPEAAKPAGLVRVILLRTDATATVVWPNGKKLTFQVHKALPHYIEGWAADDGATGRLVGGCERVEADAIEGGGLSSPR